MDREIILSRTAEVRFEKLFSYLQDEWSESIKTDYIQKLDRCLEIIKENPEIFPESLKNKGLRKCVVTKQNTLFYRFSKNQIMLVTVFDTRQVLKKLRKDIK